MSRVGNLRVAMRLGGAFSVLAALLLVVAFVGLSAAMSAASLARSNSKALSLVRAASMLNADQAIANGAESSYGLAITDGNRSAESDTSVYRGPFLAALRGAQADAAALSHLSLTAADAKDLLSFNHALQTFIGLDEHAIADYRLNTPTALRAANHINIDLTGPPSAAMSKAAGDIVQRAQAAADQVNSSGRKSAATSETVVVTMGVLALLLAAGLATLITMSITRPLAETLEVIEAVADGDLTATLPCPPATSSGASPQRSTRCCASCGL